jgi:hypothetical protein
MLTQHFRPFCAKPHVVGQGKVELLLKNEKLKALYAPDAKRTF